MGASHHALTPYSELPEAFEAVMRGKEMAKMNRMKEMT